MATHNPIAAMVLAAAVTLVAGCGAAGAAPSRPGPVATPTATRTPAPPSAAPTSSGFVPDATAIAPTATAPAPAAALVPRAVIDVPDLHDVVWMTTGDGAIWTNGIGVAWRIDKATNAATSIPVDLGGSRWAGIGFADGDLWATAFDTGHILRIDPSTGAVKATIDTPHPAGFVRGDGLWFSHEYEGGISHIDVKHNRIDVDIPSSTLSGGGATFWYRRSTATSGGPEAVEAETATGKELRTVRLPPGTDCALFIEAARRLWTSCSSNPASTAMAAIDLGTGRSSTFRLDTSFIGGMVLAGGSVWGLVGHQGDRPARMVQLAPDGPTGVIVTLPDGLDPDGGFVSDGSLWIASEGPCRVYRFDIDALAALAEGQ